MFGIWEGICLYLPTTVLMGADGIVFGFEQRELPIDAILYRVFIMEFSLLNAGFNSSLQ